MNRIRAQVFTVLLAFLAVIALGARAALAQETAKIDISYTKFVLKNGLTLIVHEDRKAPIVSVNIWYHVGSKDEKVGRTGLAHLYEHLMFKGSEHYNDDYKKALERLGPTEWNGSTWNDRTNYSETVPTPALDVVLWMESDRMGHLLGAVNQAKLDGQRGDVQNEKRLRENEPYGRVEFTIAENTYPKGHPYSWSVFGSVEDISAASLDEVKEWFRSYYGAANAVIVLAGDIDPETARQKVERYFGDIPSGPPVTRYQVWIAKRTGEQRQVMQDRVPQARLYKVWNIPQFGAADTDYLSLVADVLTLGKMSRLYKRLVYDEGIATNGTASVDAREIGGQFTVMTEVRPGVDLPRVEKAMDEELARFLRDGPTQQELDRVKTQRRGAFIRGIERIGSNLGGKSDVLAMNEVFTGKPDFYKVTLNRWQEATVANLREAANPWLSDGVYVLEVRPFPMYETIASTVDRSALPKPGPAPASGFPRFERVTLANGLKLIVVERQSVPLVNLTLLVDAGHAADQSGLPGTAKMTMDMLAEGTTSRNALQISEELASLGAILFVDSELDQSRVTLSALKERLDPALTLFADVTLNPSFPKEELERLRKRRHAEIQQDNAEPFSMALRVLPKLIYDTGHAYASPLTGSGTMDSVNRITREDLVKFHQSWLKPNHSTLIVVGATTRTEIQPKIEKLFAGWQRGDLPPKKIRTVELSKRPSVYIMDRPGALQSIIVAGNVAPPKANPQEVAIEALNRILSSRIFMNLSQDKHWAYGAGTSVLDARGQRLFFAMGSVQTDKTKEAIQELLKEFQGILGNIPVTGDELLEPKEALTLNLPGRWETMADILDGLRQIVNYGQPDDYYDTLASKVNALRADDILQAAKTVVHPGNLVWVIVGDRWKIEPGLRELNLGTIRLIDGDGSVLGEVK